MGIGENIRDGLIGIAVVGGTVLVAAGAGIGYLVGSHMVPIATTAATTFLAINATNSTGF